MFSGILDGVGTVVELQDGACGKQMRVSNSGLFTGIRIGASVSIDGTCLTVVEVGADGVVMDVVPRTLETTTLDKARVGSIVNIERALRFGDEVGGHLLSGHVAGIARLTHIDLSERRHRLHLTVPVEVAKYVFDKAYIGLGGASLTVSSKDGKTTAFTVDLIPETLRVTNLGSLEVGDEVNIEVDAQTRTIVDTVAAALVGRIATD